MPLDLDDVGSDRTRWLALEGALRGVEVLVRFASPAVSDAFRSRLIRAGIYGRTPGGGWELAAGRGADFCREFAAQYVLDWRGDIRPEGAKYSAADMGRVLHAYAVALDQLTRAIGEEEAFFQNGAAAPTRSSSGS